VHHPKSPAIRWAADYPIFTPDRDQIAASRQLTKRANKRHRAASLNHLVGQRE